MNRGRPKNDEQSERVYIRIPPAELVQHKRDAKAMGLSLSAYLRLCINGVMKSHQEPPKES